MDKYLIKDFFYQLILLGISMPGRPGFGSPISWLLETMCIHQDCFLSRIVGDFTGDTNECKINNAGLKLYWRVEKRMSNGQREFKCRIGGDQAKDYHEFVAAANELIKKYNYQRR